MATVTVGCKLAHGLIMELIGEGHLMQPAPLSEQRAEIKGANSLRVKGTNPLNGQIAYTTVDKALADEWFKRNKGLRFVKDGSVFMQESASAAQSEGKSRAELKTGFEPLDPTNLRPGMQADKEHLKRLQTAVL